MADNLPEPKSREESYLAKAAGMDTSIPATPESRKEQYLAAIAEGGGGGGTSDFDQLTNRPKYNGTAMTGETNIPDINSVVGKVKELTSADYDYPTNNPTGVALWLLKPGLYELGDGLKGYVNTDNNWETGEKTLLIAKESANTKIYVLSTGSTTYPIRYYVSNSSTGSQIAANSLLASDVVDQTTGTSTTNIMSQRATTSMVFTDPSTKQKVQIGNTSGSGNYCVSIGNGAIASANRGVAIGMSASATTGRGNIAIGESAYCNASGGGGVTFFAGRTHYTGEFAIGLESGYESYGYNNSRYRLLTGVYDGQSNHDAATVAQGNKLMTVAPTTTDAGVLGQLWTDTTAMHTYQLTAIDTTDPSNPSYTWTQRW